MNTDTGRIGSADRAGGPADLSQSSLSQPEALIPCADSGNLHGYYGILSKDGGFWSFTVHSSKREAENYIKAFWGLQTDMAETCLRDFRIIEVRVRLEPRQAPLSHRVEVLP